MVKGLLHQEDEITRRIPSDDSPEWEWVRRGDPPPSPIYWPPPSPERGLGDPPPPPVHWPPQRTPEDAPPPPPPPKSDE